MEVHGPKTFGLLPFEMAPKYPASPEASSLAMDLVQTERHRLLK